MTHQTHLVVKGQLAFQVIIHVSNLRGLAASDHQPLLPGLLINPRNVLKLLMQCI
jgi:hypothetical protein